MVQGEPQASGIAEEEDGDQHAKPHRERELLREGQAHDRVEYEDTAERHRRGHCVVYVDGSHEVTRLPLETKVACRAPLVHGDEAAVERRAPAARTEELQRAPEDATRRRLLEWDRGQRVPGSALAAGLSPRRRAGRPPAPAPASPSGAGGAGDSRP